MLFTNTIYLTLSIFLVVLLFSYLFIRKLSIFEIIQISISFMFGLFISKLLHYFVLISSGQDLETILSDYKFLGLLLLLILVFLKRKNLKYSNVKPKILDYNSLVDTRILDMCYLNFLSGEILVPKFIIKELKKNVDIEDKKQEAIKGFEILARLQNFTKLKVKIIRKNFSKIPDINEKLIKLAKKIDADLITSDFMLNNLAISKGVSTLNLDDLSNILKTKLVPNETLIIYILRGGKEKTQGIGYLNDGNMVVIEDGKSFIGKLVKVKIKRVLETSVGKIIFSEFVEPLEN